MPQSARVRIAREQVSRIAALTREAEALKRELRDLIRVHRPERLAETGCGPLCAAILIGQPPAPSGSPPMRSSLAWRASHRYPCPPAGAIGTGSAAAATASSTARCTSSR
jgi:transposase